MDNRQTVLSVVQEWVALDARAKEIAKLARECRIQKKAATEKLVGVMKANNVECFNMSSGQLIYTKNKSRSPVSKKHLMETLAQYFSGVPQVDAAEVAQYILDQRSVKTRESVRHKITASSQTNIDSPLSNE